MVADMPELLQQSPRHILHQRRQPNLLRLFHHRHHCRLCHPVPGLQHDRRYQYLVVDLWILDHLHGGISA